MVYKTFADYDLLTASDLNSYLMRQAIIVVADDTERDTLPSPSEGMSIYHEADGRMYTHDGSTWRAFGGDTGWTALTLNTGYISYTPGTYTPQIRRIGAQVMARGIVARNAANFATSTTYVIAALPVGYRPPSSQDAVFCQAGAIVTGTLPAIAKITPDGNIELRTPASNVSTTGYSLSTLVWTVD